MQAQIVQKQSRAAWEVACVRAKFQGQPETGTGADAGQVRRGAADEQRVSLAVENARAERTRLGASRSKDIYI